MTASVKLPITGGLLSGYDERAVRDVQGSPVLTNWMITEHGTLLSRPGITEFAELTGASTDLRALFAYDDFLVGIDGVGAVFVTREDAVWRNASVVARGGVLVPGGLQPQAVEDDETGALVLCAGGALVRWVAGDGTLTEVHCATDTELTPNASHVAVSQGYLVASDVSTDQFYYTTVDNHRRFESLRVFSAESKRDEVLAFVEAENGLFLAGPRSIDVYYPTRSDSPAFVRARTITRGVAGAGAIAQFDGTVYFLDEARRACMLGPDGGPVALSGPIERTLQGLGTASDVEICRLDIGGHYLILWTFPTEERTFVYDRRLSRPGAERWAEWRGRSSSAWTAAPIRATVWHPRWNRHFCLKPGSNKIFEVTQDAATDDGDELLRVVRTSFQGFGDGDLKHLARMRVRARRGMGTDFTADEATLSIRWRDEDMRWDGMNEELSLGDPGEMDLYDELVGLGAFRERQFELSTALPVARLELYPPELEIEQRTSR